MTKAHFIAGDWGTSNLRLYLCQIEDAQPVQLLETRFGPGISEIQGDFEDKFFNLAQEWIDRFGSIPVILSGMIGSNIGWKEAPYLSCPVAAQDIADGRVTFKSRGIEISILAGLRTTNPLQLPDVMRGEELQMLGWLRSNQDRDHHRRLFALPGTHNKWAFIDGDYLHTFITAFTGELFALLRKHSILISDDSAISFNHDAFMEGVNVAQNLGAAHLVHSLFSVRSRQVVGEMASADGLSYLSGQLAAVDVIGALELFDDVKRITVIGEPTLTEQYQIVLQHLGHQPSCCNPEEIAVAGFEAIYKTIYQH